MRRIPRREIRGRIAVFITQVIYDVGFGDGAGGEGERVGVGAGGEVAEGEDESVLFIVREIVVEVV